MKSKCVFGFWGIIFVAFICLGCTSVSGNVESAVSFSPSIPIKELIVGSFSYNINDAYIMCPDGSLIPEPASSERKTHEAYLEEEVIGSDGKPRLKQDGTRMTRIVMKSDYHIASYDELYSWGIHCAAEKAGITHIIAIKSFLTTTTKSALGVSVNRQDVTLTVFGEPRAK